MEEVDALVVGGGPAGLAAALVLSAYGKRVRVLERPAGTARFETLTYRARQILGKIGAAEALEGHAPVLGARSSWQTPDVVERSCIFDSHGQGWNVERRRFDVVLGRTARARGVDLRSGRLVRAVRDGSQWRITLDTGTLRSRFCIDATGRAGRFCRTQGSRPMAVDGTVALSVEVAEREPRDLCTEVRAVEYGWWYFVRLPSRQTLAMLVTDIRDVPRSAPQRRAWFSAALDACLPGGRLSGDNVLRMTPAWPQRRVCSGPGWLAIGDAAAALDPLSSSGVTAALASGRDGGEAVLHALAGDEVATSVFARQQQNAFRRHLELRRRYYGLVRRFACERFWHDRAA